MKYILKLTRLLTHVMYKSITIAGKFNGAKKCTCAFELMMFILGVAVAIDKFFFSIFSVTYIWIIFLFFIKTWLYLFEHH